MILRIVVGVIFWAATATFGIAAHIEFMRMIDDVNRALPAERRINPLFWHFGKYLRFREEYDRLYPGRYPRKRLIYLYIGMGVSVVGMAVTLLPLLH